MTRDEYIAGLRATADWLEEHPDVPVDPYTLHTHISSGSKDDAAGEPWVEAAAEAGGMEVVRSDHSITAVLTFGPGVQYEVCHVWRQRMAEYDAYMSYRDNVKPEPEAVSP